MKFSKIIISSILFVMISFSSFASTAGVVKGEGYQALTAKIQKQLDFGFITESIGTDEKALVFFTVNEQNELELVKVNSKNKRVIKYINKTLQGIDVPAGVLESGTMYKIRIKFVSR